MDNSRSECFAASSASCRKYGLDRSASSDHGGMVINPVTRKLYVTNSGASSVSVVDLTTNSVVKTEFLFSNAPERVAVDPIINRIYVAGYGNFLVDQIDGNTDTNIGYRSVNCTYPNDVAINAQNRDLFMPCWSDQRLLTYRFLTP